MHCYRLEESGGALANFSTVLGPFFDRFAEVEPDEDARIRVLGRGLGEAGIRAEHWRRIAAGAAGRKRHATILEADPVGAEELLQDFSTRSPFDGVTRGIVLIGGVGRNGVQDVSPPLWIAVTGRQ